ERAFIAFRDGAPAVTDGPFGEVKEQLAGLFVVDVDNFERAKEVAGPISEYGVVEIRALMEDAGTEM
ncbi:MAG: YciI family protein, partial [Nocardioidaceae bacterium]